jgi:hypothetical protein
VLDSLNGFPDAAGTLGVCIGQGFNYIAVFRLGAVFGDGLLLDL